MENTSSGTPLARLLVVLFIGLRLAGYIDWAWWWIASPLLIMGAINGIIALDRVIKKYTQ